MKTFKEAFEEVYWPPHPHPVSPSVRRYLEHGGQRAMTPPPSSPPFRGSFRCVNCGVYNPPGPHACPVLL